MIRNIGKILSALIVFALTFPYAAAPIYEIAPAPLVNGKTTTPTMRSMGAHMGMRGDTTSWFNPYTTAVGQWYKANLHLHSHAWFGTTDGRTNSLGAIDSAYRALGYGALTLSNYQRIDSLGFGWHHIPCYEHGYNIQKTHQLVVGARSVIWLDCILPQTLFVKQWILDILRPTAEVLIAAHPAFGRPSYTPNDMALLGGYDCIEIFNHYRTSLVHWDSALTNGIVVWGVGNDDCHDVSSEGETGVCLTLVALPELWKAPNLYHAYRNGHTIAVRTRKALLPVGVPKQLLSNDTLVILLEAAADSVRFISNGRVVSCSYSTTRAALKLPRHASYVRAEVFAGETIYALNPVVAQKHTSNDFRRLVENLPLTLIYRLLWILLYTHMFVYLRRKRS